jgi:hypothetical protein
LPHGAQRVAGKRGSKITARSGRGDRAGDCHLEALDAHHARNDNAGYGAGKNRLSSAALCLKHDISIEPIMHDKNVTLRFNPSRTRRPDMRAANDSAILLRGR